MRLFKNRSVAFYLGFVLILSLAVVSSAIAAFAASPSSTSVAATVKGGSLTESAPGSVEATPVTLNGTDQTTTYTLPLTVNDFTGTGAGWHLTITSTLFSNTDAPILKLASKASRIIGAAAVCSEGTCMNPKNGISYPLFVPAGKTAPTAVPFFQAQANTGMGGFTITPTISIVIPANIYVGTYTSTITVAASTGP